MTGRAIPEWRGKTPDAAIPKAVRLRVFERYGGVCQLSGRKIRAGDRWDVDHRLALGLGGEHAESNLWPVLCDSHKAKTAEDVRMIRKAQRQKAKHLGIKSSGRKILSRGFDKRFSRRFDGTVVRRDGGAE